MQNAGAQNTAGVLAIKDDMTACLHPSQTGPNIVTSATQCRIVGQHLAARLKVIQVAGGLILTPSTQGIIAYAKQIRFGASRETEEGHG